MHLCINIELMNVSYPAWILIPKLNIKKNTNQMFLTVRSIIYVDIDFICPGYLKLRRDNSIINVYNLRIFIIKLMQSILKIH
jgi:hypothetical protein